MCCWETLGPVTHVEVDDRSHPPNTFADRAHPVMGTALPNGRGSTSRTLNPATPQKLLISGLRSWSYSLSRL